MNWKITIEPMTPKNSQFGSAPNSYWRHANFDRAYVDGFPDNWKCGDDTSKRHPDDYKWQYLKVPCHCQRDYPKSAITADARKRVKVAPCPKSRCKKCWDMGWSTTTHRLFYRHRHHKNVLSVRIGKLGKRWCWIVTRRTK